MLVWVLIGMRHIRAAKFLKNNTILHYKCTNYRSAKSEVGIMWNDPELKIHWPKKKFIISKKDKNNLSFSEFKKKFLK